MNELRRVYIDNSATTPLRPEVLDAMLPFLKGMYGNPSSGHHFGREVKARILEAREIVAEALGASPSEILFTSGGTEADNIAIKGYAWGKNERRGGHLITSTIEHPAVLEPMKYLSKNGFDVTHVDVDPAALIHPENVAEALRRNTILVSVMHANNEVGSIQPVKEIAELVKEKGAAIHTDAVQSFMKIPVNVDDLGVDMLSVSAHKINGPKGVGVLYVRKGTKLDPLSHGGHHEWGKRAGTENAAGIAGLAKAVQLGLASMEENTKKISKLRDDLESRIIAMIPHVRVNGSREKRLPGSLNISFECVEGEALLINLDMVGIAISTGSACSSGSLDPSHVLMAMGIPHEIIHGSLRFSLGHANTMEDNDYIMAHLPRIIDMVRNISPLWDMEEGKPISLEEAERGANLH